MINRYPHIGFLITSSEGQDENGDFEEVLEKVEIKGRFEPSVEKRSLDYSAKFFCRLLDTAPFELDEKSFEYEGRSFKIIQLHNYQTHTEIWLD